MTELCILAEKYKSDKCPQTNQHSYTPFYFELLKDKKTSVKKVVEVGIGYPQLMRHVRQYQTGASLFMWRDFFLHAQIYGADNNPDCLFTDERIETILCDQYDGASLKSLIDKTGTDIDLFIDDGSHILEHQIFTCKTVLPMLKKDVIYIIEDMKDPWAVAAGLEEFFTMLVSFPGGRGSDNHLLMVRRND